MSARPGSALLSHLTGAGDGELVVRFRDTGNGPAFAELVRRHGPMVLGACQRVLNHRQDAEDAFQAVFLVLALKPDRVRPPGRIGAWLHGVAHLTALKARRSAARRERAERTAAEQPRPTPPHDPDLLGALDAAVLGLPEKYRLPVVECHLAGRSRREAAARLGCSEGTLSGRLARALDLLAARLARRGIGLPGAALAGVLLTRPLSAAVPAGLAASTVAVARLVGDDQLPGGAVTALTQKVLKIMWIKKLQTGSLALTAVALLGAAFALLTPAPAPAEPPLTPPPAAPRAERGAAPTPKPGAAWVAAHTLRREHAITEVAVHGESIALADEGGGLVVWKTGEKEPQVVLKGSKQPGPRPIAHLTYTGDGKFLYFATNEERGMWRHEFSSGRTYGVGGGGGIGVVGFSSDGRTVIETHSKRRTVRLQLNGWDEYGAPDEVSFDAPVDHAVLDARAGQLAVTTGSKIVLLARSELKARHTIEVKGLRANAVRFSADGKVLAVVGEDGFARLYDTATGTESARLKGPKGFVFAVAFSPDGKTVAAAGDDNVVRVWLTKGGEPTAELKGHTDSVRALQFGPTGTVLISGSADKTATVWELKK